MPENMFVNIEMMKKEGFNITQPKNVFLFIFISFPTDSWTSYFFEY